MMLGMALKGAKECQNIQLLLPASEGADADGQYWRVIRTILNEKGCQSAKVIPLVEEQLVKLDVLTVMGGSHRDVLFLKLLEGDLYYMAPASKRESLFAEMCEGKVMSWEDICGLASRVRKNWENPQEENVIKKRDDEPDLIYKHTMNSTTLGIVGEWPLVYEDGMNNGFWKKLEDRGYHLYRMPLSEYLYFMWKDASSEEKREMTDVTSNDEWLKKWEKRMAELHKILGDASAFSGNIESLMDIADERLMRYAGAGGRYRYAKAIELWERSGGTIHASSMYENTEIMLKAKCDHKSSGSILFLEFDGVMNQGAEEKLESFLYYM